MGLLEYGRLLLHGAKEPDKVIRGWINDAMLESNLLKEEDIKVILKRRSICETCPFMSKNAKTSQEYKDLTGENYIPIIKSDHCSFCGCPIKQRTASLRSACGASHWNKENPNKKIELKWKEM